jgi:GNAT superfamily N-acetyltransferase
MSIPAQVEITKVSLEAIRDMREDYRRAMACQIVHDSWHERGFTRSYLLRIGQTVVGYGAVGGSSRENRDILKEFFVLPEFRGDALRICRALIAASGARMVEAQTNDALLSLMLYDCAADITSDTILFADGMSTALPAPAGGATFRPLTKVDRTRVFSHSHEPVGDYGIEVGGVVAGTGGLMFHYNPPYGDVYMEVDPAYRRQGIGSYLIQELKRVCYEMGCLPAARCSHTNTASRLTLQRAGMIPCARILSGRLVAG